MEALDTNILVRFLVKDEPGQAELSRRYLRRMEKAHERVFVENMVVLEMGWVLQYVYEYTREEIAFVLDLLLRMPVLQFENSDVVKELAGCLREENLEFADMLIALSALSQGCETVRTLDKSAAKSPWFTLLK